MPPGPADGSHLAALREVPAARAALDAVAGEGHVFVVGGAVRDVLRGVQPIDVDFAVEGDPVPVAVRVAERLGGAVQVHERFSTAVVRAGEAAYDFARTRRERYPEPGALPEVMPAALEDDLRRRDFGVNALALDASGERPGIFGDDSSLADLDRRRLRVLHDASFRDDPTRLLRLARYHARLAFEIEPHTRELAREAIGAEALSTVSGPRVGHELRLLAREPDPVAAMNAVRELGLERAIHPDLEIDLGLAEAALRALPVEGRAELVVLAAACSALPPGELSDFTGRLGFDRGEARVAVALTESLPAAAARLAGARRPSEIDAELSGRTLEEAALLAALGSAEPVRRWLEELRHIRLDIDGDDLRRAGAPEGPAIGAGLARARAGRLDGELPTREAQLEAALRMQQR